jgi:ADP-heptose:LPS heptosyltransferase
MNLPFADYLLSSHVRRLASRSPVRPIADLRLGELRRVLVVLTTGLGDAVLSTPVLPALRRAMPDAEIRLFCRAAWAPLFTADPDVDAVIPYAGKYRRFFPTLGALRAFSPELAVVLHGNDPDILPLCYLAGSRFIVRIPTTGTRHGFLLSNRGRDTDRATLPGVHYIENRLRILDTIGAASVTHSPRVYLAQSTGGRSGELAQEEIGRGPYWVLHARAADAYKAWPAGKSRKLLERARAAWPGYAVVLTGSAQDREQLESLAAGVTGVHNFAGRLDITGTAALLRGASCVVAPDTGVAHLSSALDVPVVALYAPTFSELVRPRARHAVPIILQKPRTCDPCVEKQCPYTPRNCMDQIGVDDVFDALGRTLH